MEKLVSVVLPVYNGEKYLSQAIESVLGQTYKDIELIVVNDCSTDSTEDIVLKYTKKDKRIIYVKNETNKKLPASLNIGFSHATGDYYTWTSDDNYYELNAIEKMVTFLEKNQETNLVTCTYKQIFVDSDREPRIVKPDSNIMFKNRIGACFLYTKDIAQRIGKYNESLFLLEDYDYWLRISDVGKIGVLDECLYVYRHHSKSLTATKQAQIKNLRFKYQYKKRLKVYIKNKIDNIILFPFMDYLLLMKDKKLDKGLVFIKMVCKKPKFFLWKIKKHRSSRQ